MKTCMKTPKDRARAEIYSVLEKDMKISADRMDRILAKHGIRRDTKALQRTYRLSVGQRIMADIKDTDGRREILAARTESGTEYIVLDACHDPKVLGKLQQKLCGCISSLESTSGKVEKRQRYLAHFRQRLFHWRKAV